MEKQILKIVVAIEPDPPYNEPEIKVVPFDSVESAEKAAIEVASFIWYNTSCDFFDKLMEELNRYKDL